MSRELSELRNHAETIIRVLDEVEKWKRHSMALHSENRDLREAIGDILGYWMGDYDISKMGEVAQKMVDKYNIK